MDGSVHGFIPGSYRPNTAHVLTHSKEPCWPDQKCGKGCHGYHPAGGVEQCAGGRTPKPHGDEHQAIGRAVDPTAECVGEERDLIAIALKRANQLLLTRLCPRSAHSLPRKEEGIVVDFDAAISFVRKNGDEVERARLRYLLHSEVPTLESVGSLLAGQRSDGGWAPFWSPDYGSLDATCYRLAQIEQLGIANAPAVARAVQFLEKRQHDDGSWEEDDSVKAQAPPWAVPGDPAAKLYLTANCGYWLVMLQGPGEAVDRAANLLDEQVQPHGQLPTFPHAHWLAAGFLYAAGRTMTATAIICHLERNLVAMLPASNLAWLLVTLLGAGVPPQHSIVKQASSQLEHMQQADGRWVSEDGPDRDVHATLEALRALQLSGLGVSTN